MKNETREILGYLSLPGIDYADVRIVRREIERIKVKNQKVETASSIVDYGYGIRVLFKGAWGFSSSSLFGSEGFRKTAEEAFNIARASRMVKDRETILAPTEVINDRWVANYEKDPFKIPLNEKVMLLMEAEKLLHTSEDIKIGEASMEFFKEDKSFASSEGSYIEQSFIESGAGVTALAIKNGEVQKRSYPSSFGGDYRKAGWEFIEGLNLPENATRVGEEASQLLYAPPVPAVVSTLILDGTQMTLQIHESCGHPTELDRVMGSEASYAGTSFLTPDKLNNFQYGSSLVNLYQDATEPYGLGSYAYDDEGIKARKTYLVKAGQFVGYLTSRETAMILKQNSNATMRADGWNRLPLIRMTNINIEPGDKTLGELIGEVDNGFYMLTNKSWSIDDKRLNFQFGCEIAYEIKDGKLGKIHKNPTYTGITYEFWRNMDALCNADYFRVWGLPNCGKGEPPQTARVGHGTVPARFRNVRMGVVK